MANEIEEIGMPLLNGRCVATDLKKADTDSDGLKDGEEVSVLPKMTVEDCKRKVHVIGDITSTIGAYWESYTITNGRKEDSTEKRIYLIPFGDQGQFIGINVENKEFERMEALTNATSARNDLKSMTEVIKSFDGYVKKCDRRMKRELKQTYVSRGGTGNYEEVFVPYYIEVMDESNPILYVIMVIMLLIGVVFLIIFIIKYKKEEVVIERSDYIGRVIFDRNRLTSREDM